MNQDKVDASIRELHTAFRIFDSAMERAIKEARDAGVNECLFLQIWEEKWCRVLTAKEREGHPPPSPQSAGRAGGDVPF